MYFCSLRKRKRVLNSINISMSNFEFHFQPMITRIVKLTLEPDKIESFMNIFAEVKDTIADFDGCHHVELLQEIHSPHIFFTYSIWEDEHFLNHYRFSDFFKQTWERS